MTIRHQKSAKLNFLLYRLVGAQSQCISLRKENIFKNSVKGKLTKSIFLLDEVILELKKTIKERKDTYNEPSTRR